MQREVIEDDGESTNNPNRSKQSKDNFYALGMPKFNFKLSPEEEELETNIRNERQPAYQNMVKLFYETQEINKKCIISITNRYIQ